MLADERRRAVDQAGRLREVDQRAELAHAAEQRVVVLGDEAEPLVVGVEQHALAGLACRTAISLGTPAASSSARPLDRGARREARLEQRLELLAVLGARRARREAGVVASSGTPSARAQRRPSARLRPPRSGSSLLASRTGGSTRRCRSGALSSRGPRHRFAVDEHRVGREHRAAVEQRRPQLLAFAGHALVVQRGEAPDDRQHRVGGVGHAEAEVARRVAFAHRTLLVLEPGRRLVERVEPAEVARAVLRGRTPRCCSTRCRALTRLQSS